MSLFMSLLLTADQMRALEAQFFAAGYASCEAMERAGAAVAEVIAARTRPGKALILCGPGNNGGDGYVVGRHLVDHGYTVQLASWDDPALLRGDAAHMRGLWQRPVLTLAEADERQLNMDILVDALFGIGYNRPADAAKAAQVQRIAARASLCVAVDVPSGVHSDTGEIITDMICADITVTFGMRKLCHALQPAAARCGEVIVAPIGFAGEVPDAVQLVGPPMLKTPTADAHKYSRGAVLVASGGLANTGAARLAARAALRGGAGAVTVLSPANALAVHAHHLTAVMLRRVDDAAAMRAAADDPRVRALVIGPAHGVTDYTRDCLLALLQSPVALVLDADALTVIAAAADMFFTAIKARTAPVVLTPHAGEFARLFPDLAQPGKVARTQAAAARSGAVLLHKGPDTVIAAPEGACAINNHGTPWLATAGSGDVLAGLIAARLAQGDASFDAACHAAWLHGDAGLRCGPGLIAEDLPEYLPEVLRDLPSLRFR